MGVLAIFGHIWRPQVDTQNTGRAPYQRPFGVGTVSVQGQGGAMNYRSLSPVAPMSVNIPVVRQASIQGQGNGLSTNPLLEPLIDKDPNNPNIGLSNMPQF